MSRLVSRPLLLVALLAFAAGCALPGGPAESGAGKRAPVPELAPDQHVSIVWETYNAADQGSATVEKLVRRFEELNPNIDVTVQPPRGGPTEFTQSVHRQVVAGNPPDVAQLVFGDLRFVASDLGAQPLAELFGEDAVKQHLNSGEHPYHPRAAVLGDLDGITYGIPYVVSTPVLFYNADLFRAAGLDPAHPPTNWAQVREAAVAISKATDAGGIYAGCVEVGNDWCLHGILNSNGGQALSEDGTKLTWADPSSVEAVATLQGLVQAGPDVFPNITSKDALDRFSRGNLGMVLNSSALQFTFLKASKGAFELGLTGMPGFGDKPSSPTNSGAALFIMAKDPAKQRASWELIKFLTSPEAQTILTENIGYVPLRSTLIKDPQYLRPFTEAQGGLVEPNVAQLDRLEPWPSFSGPNYDQIRRLLMAAVSEVVFRGADPTVTLQIAQDRAEKLMR
ncbi:ABC transporter substrate-binding protein [Nocardia sp. NPDC058379]|uniref:ABC transporter substrate-binding protein n=1 Tax=unclassified Nocardia TaxID=2637762 RepID=UPI003646F844